jgi:DNA-binding transcriptional ArsR family regulator
MRRGASERLAAAGRTLAIPVDGLRSGLYLTMKLITRIMPDTLSATFAALADPTRRAILTWLAEGSATVNELAEPFAISLPAVSRHLKVLERARLITREREAQWRRCRLAPEPLAAAADWVERYRVFWESRLDALDGLLARESPAKEKRHGRRPRRRR